MSGFFERWKAHTQAARTETRAAAAADQNHAVERYVTANSKSRSTSLLLTLLLGPLGLLYASVVAGVILLIVAIVTFPTAVGPVIAWVISVFVGDSATVRHNKRVRSQADLMVAMSAPQNQAK